MSKGNDYGCVTRQVIRQRCAPEEVEPGKHVYRCEKTIQTLRDCVGRPAEVIDSQTEITQQEIDGRWNHGLHISMEQSSSSISANWDRDIIQELDNVIEGVERMTEGIMGGFKRITEEAERITGSLFGFPSFPEEESENRNRHVFFFPVNEEEREEDEREGYEMQESTYSDFADKVKEV